MGNCGRCWLKQDLCLAEGDGETEASANLLTMIWRSDSLCVMRAQLQQTVLPGLSFSQSLSWLSVGEGRTGSRQADVVGTLPVQGP